jgi:hypothetical protein
LIGPWGPLVAHNAEGKQDMLGGLAVTELSSLLHNEASRRDPNKGRPAVMGRSSNGWLRSGEGAATCKPEGPHGAGLAALPIMIASQRHSPDVIRYRSQLSQRHITSLTPPARRTPHAPRG